MFVCKCGHTWLTRIRLCATTRGDSLLNCNAPRSRFCRNALVITNALRAQVPAAIAAGGELELRVLVDGGVVETFLGRRIAITSLISLPVETPPAPPAPPHHAVRS